MGGGEKGPKSHPRQDAQGGGGNLYVCMYVCVYGFKINMGEADVSSSFPCVCVIMGHEGREVSFGV